MLQAIIYGKRAKNHQKKKQIVDAERFFDQVAGKEFEGRLGATEIEHSESKEDGDSDPAKTSNGRLANLDLVRAAVENTQGQRDRNSDEEVERKPMKGRPHGGARRRYEPALCASME